jgi:hypothetical protein
MLQCVLDSESAAGSVVSRAVPALQVVLRYLQNVLRRRFPVTARSKARVCGGWLSGIAVSNPAAGTVVCHVSVLCCL